MPSPITVTDDHGTKTYRGEHLSIDVTVRPETNVRKGLHVVIDDDCAGRGTRVRLHMYGQAAFDELRALVERVGKDLERENADDE